MSWRESPLPFFFNFFKTNLLTDLFSHNLIADHSARHSYYTCVQLQESHKLGFITNNFLSESLVINYFPKIAAKISPQPSSSGPSQPQKSNLSQSQLPRSLLDLD